MKALRAVIFGVILLVGSMSQVNARETLTFEFDQLDSNKEYSKLKFISRQFEEQECKDDCWTISFVCSSVLSIEIEFFTPNVGTIWMLSMVSDMAVYVKGQPLTSTKFSIFGSERSGEFPGYDWLTRWRLNGSNPKDFLDVMLGSDKLSMPMPGSPRLLPPFDLNYAGEAKPKVNEFARTCNLLLEE